MAAEIEELKAENQRLCNEITELKGITEPGKDYLHRDGFTLAVDLANAEAITTANVSRNQVPALNLAHLCALLPQPSRCQPTCAKCRTRWSSAR
eukprot:3941714-Pleurochrysis_carterae.AAC.1